MKYLVIVLMSIYSGFVAATPQIMDRMNVEGENLQILNSPLAPIFSDKGKVWLEEVWFVVVPQFECSASWRGFYVQWSIKNSKLYMDAIFGDPCNDEPKLISSHVLFPDKNYPIFAEWYSGEVPVQVSDLLFVEDVTIDGEDLDVWYKCTTKYFSFDRGKLMGSETRDTYQDCYVY